MVNKPKFHVVRKKRVLRKAHLPSGIPKRRVSAKAPYSRSITPVGFTAPQRWSKPPKRKIDAPVHGNAGRKPTSLPVYPEVWNTDYVFAVESSPTDYLEFPRSYERFFLTRTSVRTPGFHKLKGSKLPVNPFHFEKRVTNDGQGYDLRSSSQGISNSWDRTSALWPEVSPPQPVHDVQSENKVITKLIERAQLDLNANIAQDLAQIGQTTRLITTTCYRITNAIRDVRRGNVAGALRSLQHGDNRIPDPGSHVPSRFLKAHAQNWLELQYGWKPLLQDVDGAMRALANTLAKDRVLKEVRATVRGKPVKVVRTLFSRVATPTVKPAGTVTNISQTNSTIGVRYKVESSMTSFLAQLGFTNPINLAWEVLPYSFVVDWFIPVGTYLSELSAWDGLAFLDGFKTNFTVQETFASAQFSEGPIGPTHFVSRCGGSYSRTWVICDREKLVAFPRSRFPHFKNPLSTTHATNALALMVSAFR